MGKDLIALAEEFEEKAKALRLAHALMQEHGTTTARKNLPTTLRAATKIRAPYKTKTGKTSHAESILLALRERPMTYAELTAAGLHASNVASLDTRGLVTKTQVGVKMNRPYYRYALTATGRARLDKDTTPAPAPETNGNGHHPAPPVADSFHPAGSPLQGKALTGFLLTAIERQPQTSAVLVTTIRNAGHPLKNGTAIVGVLARAASMEWINRSENGVYRITAKGRTRIRELVAAGTIPDSPEVAS